MTGQPPSIPIPAATLLLLRDEPFEVLMARRRARGQFSSALVFPGGMVDPEDRSASWLPLVRNAGGLDGDQRALRVAAIRETYEEAGILLGGTGDASFPPPEGPVDAAAFRTMIADAGETLDLGLLVPFGHWIAPAIAPRRFDTHFFVAAAPAGHEAVCDGCEIVALEWVRPSDILRRVEAGEGGVVLPTRMNLQRLSESRNSAEALARAAARPVVTVEPRVVRRPEGTFVVIPEEAGYGVIEEFRY